MSTFPKGPRICAAALCLVALGCETDLAELGRGAVVARDTRPVARPTGTHGPAARWLQGFAFRTPTKLMGDVDGDGKSDVVAFAQHHYEAERGKVWVALSDGVGAFRPPRQWHAGFCVENDEVCLVGDFDGDGRDDIAALAPNGPVTVALSTGTSFGRPASWHIAFGRLGQEYATDDLNADGRDDLVAFVKGSQLNPRRGFGLAARRQGGGVHIALSEGSTFGIARRWNDRECDAAAHCYLGDVSADRRADLVIWPGYDPDQVYVVPNRRTDFGARWTGTDLPGRSHGAADLSGNGRAELVSFQADDSVRVAVWRSAGDPGVSRVVTLPGLECLNLDGCALADVDGDRRADVVDLVYHAGSGRQSGDVWVSLSRGVPTAAIIVREWAR